MNSAFSVTSAITHGWEMFKKKPFVYVGAVLIGAVAQFVLMMILPQPLKVTEIGASLVLYQVLSFLISSLVALGFMHLALRAYENPDKASIKDMWYPKVILSYLGASILSGLVIGIGFILLIVPGIFLALIFGLTTILVVDRGLMPIAAMKESARITKGKRWSLFLFFIVIAIMNMIAAVLLLIPLLISIPVSLLAFVHVYHTLQKGNVAQPSAKQEEQSAPQSAPEAPAGN